MATVTAGTLIAAGLRRAEMRNSATGFIQHPASGGGEAFDYLNAALSELFDIMNESESFRQSNALQATSQGVADYAWVTAAMYRLTGIMLTREATSGSAPFYGVQGWKPLHRVTPAEMTKFQTPGEPVAYDFTDTGIRLFPTPDAAYNVLLVQELYPPEADDDNDAIDLRGPYREFVELHFAIQCKEKADLDSTPMRTRLYGPAQDGKGGLCQRIRDAAKKRDSVGPMRPVDVMGDDGGFADLPPFAGWTG
jgi:hypothetical protein